MIKYENGEPVFDLDALMAQHTAHAERIRLHQDEIKTAISHRRWALAKFAIHELEAIAMHDENPFAVTNAKAAADEGRHAMREHGKEHLLED